MAPGPLRNHKSLDFLLAQSRLAQAAQRRQGKPVANGKRQISLRMHLRSEHALAAEFAGDLFDDGDRHESLLSKTGNMPQI